MKIGEKQFDYDSMVQDALRCVVRDVLRETASHGLFNDHHFYIAFATQQAGVILPRYLKQRYPNEMTIVLQHQFWGLKVHDDRFEVNLSFSGVPEKVVIPFDAIIGFLDPSVQFGLQFRVSGSSQQALDEGAPRQAVAAETGKLKDAGAAGISSAPRGPGDNNVVTLDTFRKK